MVYGTKKITPTLGHNEVFYTVSSSDYVSDGGEGKKLDITYVTRARKNITINFDNTKYKCYNFSDEMNEVSSGSSVKEQSCLIFKVKDLAEDKIVTNWYYYKNGSSFEIGSRGNTSLRYIVCDDGFRISRCEIADAASATINFGAGITCTKNGTSVSSGDTVYEGTTLILSADSTKSWSVNGNNRYVGCSSIELEIDSFMCSSGTITVTAN